MTYYLGIDGGGTKTTCAVGDGSRALATATAGPSNVVRVGEPQARESLQQAVRAACAAAGITPGQVARTCVGVAGAARPEVARSVWDFLAESLASPIDVVTDIEIALEAAFGEGPGVIVIAGTGSIAYGRNAQGTNLRAGGWGFAIGDEGSAYWIGRAAVQAVLREADPRSVVASGMIAEKEFPPASLTAAVMKAWGVTSIPDLARAANGISPPDFAGLFPDVAASSDVAAGRILADAGRELAAVAGVVIRGLFGDRDEALRVAVTGGVFRYAEPVREVFYNELRALDSRADVSRLVVDPVEGALQMARRGAAKLS